MPDLRVAFIGTGRKWKAEGATGFGMAYAHASGYKKLAGVELVACADIKKENADAFAAETGTKRAWTNYREMLRKEKPDMVSVCTWPHLHYPMVMDSIKAGVKAIHCEKPMGFTFGEAKKMTEAAAAKKVKLTFNHQRRMGTPYRKVQDMIRAGELGKIVRMEAYTSNFYDWGTHWLDMLNKFNGESPALWVIGQLDWRKGTRVFGAPCDNQGIYHIGYKNGVQTIFQCGESPVPGLCFRILGEKGTAELHWGAPVLKVRIEGRDPGEFPTYPSLDFEPLNDLSIAEVVGAVREGRTSELCAENALRATEIIYAGYESSRRRGRVDLPLTIKDNPLESMIRKGLVKAQKTK
jgi:UDP-N-acetylglucosamine 3-dehydrogenase